VASILLPWLATSSYNVLTESFPRDFSIKKKGPRVVLPRATRGRLGLALPAAPSSPPPPSLLPSAAAGVISQHLGQNEG
jgi:hypothetical protein